MSRMGFMTQLKGKKVKIVKERLSERAVMKENWLR